MYCLVQYDNCRSYSDNCANEQLHSNISLPIFEDIYFENLKYNLANCALPLQDWGGAPQLSLAVSHTFLLQQFLEQIIILSILTNLFILST